MLENQTSPWAFYTSTESIWDAIYADCERAQKSIEFEQYILGNDASGWKFLTLFIEKAKAGLSVKLLLDGIGSRALLFSPLIEQLRQAGGEVHFYNLPKWLNLLMPLTWFPRSHTKTLMLDSQIVYIGSACVMDEMRHWRDTHIRLTDEDFARDVKAHFTAVWANISKKKRKFPFIASPKERAFRYVVSVPHFRPNPLYRELLLEIRSAKKRICLATPYFLPPRRLKRALRYAVRRGVDVQVIMGAETDVPLADLVARSYFKWLLRHKIKINLYQKTMQHAKYVIIDDHWATIGSMNMDYLSLERNREANTVVYDLQAIEALNDHFEQDLKNCRQASMTDWWDLPAHKKILAYMGRAIRGIL